MVAGALGDAVKAGAGLIRGKEKGKARAHWDKKGGNKSTRGTKAKPKPRVNRREQAANNRKAAEADAAAQGYVKNSRGYYIKKEVADSVKGMKKAPAKPTIGKALATLGVKAKPKAKAKPKNAKNAKRRVKSKRGNK